MVAKILSIGQQEQKSENNFIIDFFLPLVMQITSKEESGCKLIKRMQWIWKNCWHI
jgi:hypothetical protein